MNVKALSMVGAVAAACAMSTPAHAITWVYAASLNGASRTPPVTTTATGRAVVTFDDALLTITVNEIFVGLNGGPATASQVHCCTAVAGTGAAPVTPAFTGFPNAVTGSYNNVFSYTSNPAAFATLLAGAQAGKAYVNIHSAAYPGGEILGFLAGPGTPVPEPGSYALMLCGLLAVGWLSRKRKQA